MKKIKNILIVLFVCFTLVSFGQAMGPSDPGGDPSSGGGDPIGGGAPIGGGTFILLGLAGIYVGKKIYNLNKEELEE